MILQLYLHPNGYGVVVLVGLMLATIICYTCRFVTYNYKCHIIVVTWALVVCLIYNIIHPQPLSVYAYQASHFRSCPCYNYIICINSLKDTIGASSFLSKQPFVVMLLTNFQRWYTMHIWITGLTEVLVCHLMHHVYMYIALIKCTLKVL